MENYSFQVVDKSTIVCYNPGMNTKNFITGIVGLVALMAVDTTEVTTWVTCICSAVIAVVTCGLQVYHMIRDKDKDVTTDDKTEENDSEDENDNGKES